jgi:hypothetical protein
MITQKYLKELFHYDPDIGSFTRKLRRQGVVVGAEAGCITEDGRTHYRLVQIDGIKHKAHRLAWLYVHGKLPDDQIDHIDGDGLNNRIANLRDVTSRENCRNTRLRSTNKSGVVGVYFQKSSARWRAQIGTGSGNKHLGYFTDIKDAIAARKTAEIELGYHENHGTNDIKGESL